GPSPRAGGGAQAPSGTNGPGVAGNLTDTKPADRVCASRRARQGSAEQVRLDFVAVGLVEHLVTSTGAEAGGHFDAARLAISLHQDVQIFEALAVAYPRWPSHMLPLLTVRPAASIVVADPCRSPPGARRGCSPG